MSVQTTVLENGRWVTRNVDPYRVRAQNTETPRKEQSQPSINLPKTPSLGILTKTVVRSPVINRIIPARIRHKTKNDVLFISANSVTIKESKGDYTLGDIATKSDFDSAIKSARIIGEQRINTKDDRTDTMDHWDASHTSGDVDVIDGGYLLHHAAMNSPEIPPHILVLALESSRLVFLCAVSGTSDHPEFLSSQKALPAPTSPLQGLGQLLAVDPKSRAMAVAAHGGRIYVYALKSMDDLSAEFKENSRLEPVKEERLILLDGTFTQMEFLYPPAEEPNRVILLLVVAGIPQRRLVWYDWNADMPLHQAQLRPNKSLLHPDEQLPLLLIPLIKYTAFILVCEKRIVLIKDILTGGFHRYFHHLAFEQEPQEPGASRRRPIWVQWARPMRSKSKRPNQENIILCREDGIVQYLEIDHTIKQMIDSNHNVGRLGVNINTSFATVDLGFNTDDLLVVAGDECDGGLWGFLPRQKRPDKRGTIPNWTPINDFSVANVPIERQIPGTAAAAKITSKGRQRLFACSGRGKHGAISELRFGVEASRKIRSVDLDNGLKNGVLGIWALHGFYGDADEQERHDKRLKDLTYIILSHPLRTYLLRLCLKHDQDNENEEAGLPKPDVDLIRNDVGLDLNARTVAVGRSTRGFTIQITESSLRAIVLPLPPLLDECGIKDEDTEDVKPGHSQLDAGRSQPPYVYPFGNSHILAACVSTIQDNTIVVLAAEQDGQFYVEFGTFATYYRPLEQRISLHAQPSSLSLLQIEDDVLVLIGTLAGKLEIYLLGDLISGLSTSATTIYHAFDGLFGICDSIATIAGATRKGVPSLIVCGLRDGTVEVLSLSKGVGTYHLLFCEKIAFGHTSVSVIKEATTNRAIILCENTICTLEYPQMADKKPATVLNVWITDPNEPALQQGNISVISQVVDSWLPGVNPGLTADSFVCIGGSQLHTISLDSQPQIVPRRLELNGTPVRVLYSVHLEKLIVLHNKYEIPRAARHVDGQPHVRGKRILRPSISFLDQRAVDSTSVPGPDSMDIDKKEESNDHQVIRISECKSDEKFLGITEWFPKVRGYEYHMLVINTTFPRAGKPVGRLLLFAITGGKSDPVQKLALKLTIDTDESVYSVATYSDKSLVYCCGNYLFMQTLGGVADTSRIKWQSLVKIAMRSPGRHISAKEPYVYVSSSRESLSVYRYDGGQLVYQFGDQHARGGLYHLQIPSHSLILASDTDGTVVGLWQPPERRIDNAMTTVFEAVLPGSITRLRRISRPFRSHGGHRFHESKFDELSNPAVLGTEIILSSSADGTLTQMSILSSSEWRLLRFIQNMAERNPLVCPFLPGNPHRRQLEPSTARPHYMHVNGDILERVLDRGGERLLNTMLDVEPDHESHTDFGSKEDRRERFGELVKEVLKDGKGVGVMGRVVLWLRYQLRSAL